MPPAEPRSRRARPGPTPTGWAVGGGSLALVAAGSALRSTPLLVLGVAGVLALVVAVPAVVRPPVVSVQRDVQPGRVERGGTALGLVLVRNTGPRPERRLLAVDRVGAGEARLAVPVLAPGQRETVRHRLPTGRRGRLAVGPLTLVRTDPLGLLRLAQEVGDEQAVWVQPRVVPLQLREAGRSTRVDAAGPERSAPSSITFHALREYVPGDDLRHIHWRSTARTGTLMVRQHVDVSRPETTVVLDVDAGHHVDADAFEVAVDVAATLAAASVREAAPVTLVTTSGLVRRAEGAAELRGLLDLLGEVAWDDGPTPPGLAAVLPAIRGAGDALVVVTGTWADVDEAAFAALRRRHNRAAVVTAAVGIAPTAPPGVVALDVADVDELARRWTPLVGR